MAQRIRRAAVLFVLLASLVFQTGCWVFSVYPLADTDDSLVFDKLLTGNWWNQQKGCAISFSRFPSENAYRVVLSTAKGAGEQCWIGEGESASFKATVVEISGVRFMDVYPADLPLHNHMTLTHSFYRIKHDLNSLTITAMNDEFVRSQVGDDKLRGTERADNVLVLTANTKELREFLRQNATNENLWNTARKLEFERRFESQ